MWNGLEGLTTSCLADNSSVNKGVQRHDVSVPSGNNLLNHGDEKFVWRLKSNVVSALCELNCVISGFFQRSNRTDAFLLV